PHRRPRAGPFGPHHPRHALALGAPSGPPARKPKIHHPRARRGPRFARWTRLLMHVAAALFLLRLVFPRASLERRRALHAWWSRKLVRIVGVDVQVEAPPPGPGCLVAANHVSWIDVFCISSVRSTRFIAKSEVRDWPVAGW